MWVKNSGLAAAIFGLLSAGAVVAMSWYAVARVDELQERIAGLSDTDVGLLILCVMLLAGALMAFAFGKIEEAVVLYRQTHMDSAEPGD